MKLAVKAARVWKVDGKAGISLDATQMALKAAEKQVEEDLFPDGAQW